MTPRGSARGKRAEGERDGGFGLDLDEPTLTCPWCKGSPRFKDFTGGERVSREPSKVPLLAHLHAQL
jgi:hypothetical protein